MKAKECISGGVVALALLASPVALAQKPLRLDLPRAQAAPAMAAPASPVTFRSFAAPQPDVLERDRRLTERQAARADAISTLGVGLLTGLDPADATSTNTPAEGYPVLQFKKQGHLARDIKRSYRIMGENLARRVWDEPKGKRIVFDVAGKPGVGVEIPLR